MIRALAEGAYLAVWCVAILAVLRLADRLIARYCQHKAKGITAADRYAADEARRRALNPPDQPTTALSPHERASFAALAHAAALAEPPRKGRR